MDAELTVLVLCPCCGVVHGVPQAVGAVVTQSPAPPQVDHARGLFGLDGVSDS